MTARAWYDEILILVLGMFFYLEAIFLRRETRLGWAMLAKCLFLGTLFTYAGFYTLAVGQVFWCWCFVGDPVVMVLRVGIFVALAWAMAELVRANRLGDPWP